MSMIQTSMTDGTSALALEGPDGIPQYLERPRPGTDTFGILKYCRRKGERFWEIHGDPQAVMMAKRLFPGSEGRGTGVAKFPATDRMFPDLVWFLQRWPMEVEDQKQWERDYRDSCNQVVRRAELNRNPVQTMPSPDFKGILRPFQEEGLSWLLTNRRTLLADEMGLGKAQPLDAKILTPHGWKLMGNIKVGDRVINSTGGVSKVTGVFPQGERDVYEVGFTDGSRTRSCGEHLWAVRTPLQKWRNQPFKNVQLSDLKDKLFDPDGNTEFFIPIMGAAQMETRACPIDPYFLGLLLGDGGISKGVVFSNADEEILEFVRGIIPSDMTLKRIRKTVDYRIIYKRGLQNHVMNVLRDLGLFGLKSGAKFIPDCYLYNCIEVRHAVLQGLMDTDGFISKDGAAIQFTSISSRLTNDVKFLIQSLGGTAKVSSKTPKGGNLAYTLTISIPNGFCPFRLKRKIDRCTVRKKYLPRRGMTEVRSIGKMLTQCIAVDAPDHLYVTDECIVTHNTLEALAFLATAKEFPALVVAPPHLIRHWEKKTAEFLAVEENPGMPLFSADGKGGGLVVHTITGLTPYALPEAHIYLIHYLLLRAWRRTLREMEIPTVIFDEVQELRHSGTEKYSSASDISSRARSSIGLSGTPVYNRGAEIWNVINALDYHALGDYDGFTREWCTGYGKDVVKDPGTLGVHLRREGLMIRRRKEDVLQDLPPKRRVVQSLEGDHSTFRALVKTAVTLAKKAQGMTDVLERGRAERDAIIEARQATGIAKAPAVAAFVRGLLEAGEPTLVFAHHHAVFDILKKTLADFKPVCITGLESGAQKAASLEAFRTGATNLCLISLRAATGLDGLQERARVVVFAELDWSPAVHTQAEDRAHRMGLKDSVLVYYLVSEVGMDPDMQEALGLKVSQFIGLMGDSPETEDDRALANNETTSHMRAVLEKLRAMEVA